MTNTNALSIQWASYLDLEQDLKPWLALPAGESDQDPKLQDILDMACEWVQKHLGRPIAPTQFDRRFDGNTGRTGSEIMLPYVPILEVTKVVEWWGTSGPHTLSEQTPDNQVDGYQVDYRTGVIRRVFPGLLSKPWFPGSRNIEISWTAGFNPLPRYMKIATLELANWWYRNTQEATRTFRPLAEYDQAGQNGLWPAVPNRIVAMLQSDGQVGIG